MTWWRRFFGIKPRQSPLRFAPSGEYTQEIVGEMQYQVTIERLAGGRPDHGASCEVEVTAVLIWEDDNPVDAMAIRVDVQGQVVGYLTRATARQYRHWLTEGGHAGRPAICGARIVGGWDRGTRGSGYFGVELDTPAFYGPVPTDGTL
jgi:hypothetical protein